MSVAGDIINDLKFSRREKQGAVCGTIIVFSLCLFVGAFAYPSTLGEDDLLMSSGNVAVEKTGAGYRGGV